MTGIQIITKAPLTFVGATYVGAVQWGLPLILNGTQELLDGKGIAIKDYKKIGITFERISLMLQNCSTITLRYIIIFIKYDYDLTYHS